MLPPAELIDFWYSNLPDAPNSSNNPSQGIFKLPINYIVLPGKEPPRNPYSPNNPDAENDEAANTDKTAAQPSPQEREKVITVGSGNPNSPNSPNSPDSPEARSPRPSTDPVQRLGHNDNNNNNNQTKRRSVNKYDKTYQYIYQQCAAWSHNNPSNPGMGSEKRGQLQDFDVKSILRRG